MTFEIQQQVIKSRRYDLQAATKLLNQAMKNDDLLQVLPEYSAPYGFCNLLGDILNYRQRELTALTKRCESHGVKLIVMRKDSPTPLYFVFKWEMRTKFTNLDDVQAWLDSVAPNTPMHNPPASARQESKP